MDVVVTGIGLISALGNLNATWNHLLDTESGIQIYNLFNEMGQCPLALIGNAPTTLEKLLHQVIDSALNDAGLTPPLPECGVVVGSSRGNQVQWEKLMREMGQRGQGSGERGQERGREGEREKGSQTLNVTQFSVFNPQSSAQNLKLNTNHSLRSIWFDTLPCRTSVVAAQIIGTTASVLSPMAACATGLWAIAQAYQLIQSGQCQRVIAGAVEAPITPLTLTGFDRMGALARTGAYPFDRDREGLVLGEGGAVLVMESAELAESRGAQTYGRILSFGLTADGYHVNAPDPQRCAAISAVKQCLSRSSLEPEAIDYIHAHGTATQLNDYNEANLIQSLFPSNVPLSSTKGATGHTLGASGALGAALCLMAIKYQLLPPCVGLKRPEWQLDFVRTVRSASIQHTLCFSFGFGGQNAVIALGK